MTVNPSLSKNSVWSARALRSLNTVWSWLTKTPESLPASKRRQAKLLAGLLVAILVPTLFIGIIFVPILTWIPGIITSDTIPILIISGLGELLAYRLNRIGRYRPAATLTVLGLVSIVWLLIFNDGVDPTRIPYRFSYALLSIILVSILFSPRATIAMTIVHLTSIVIALWLIPGLEFLQMSSVFVLISFSSLFIVIVSFVRQNDLTQIEQQSRQLVEGEQRYRQIVETVQEGILVTDAESRATYVNHRLAEMMGYTEKEMLERSIFDFMNEEERREVEQKFQHRLKEGGSGRFDNRLSRKDGTDLWAIASIQVMHDLNGEFIGTLSLITDITERKRTEEALRKSEERFQFASSATRDAIWDWDLTTDTIWWSGGFYTLFHYQPEDVMLTVAWWSEQIHPDEREKVVNSIQSTLANGLEFWSKEYRYRQANGNYLNIFDRAYILYDEHKKPKRMIGAMIDMTARNQAEAALYEANDKLARGLTELEQRNHEIALLNGFSSLLQACQNLEEAYQVINQSVRRLFPNDSGALYVINASRNLVEVVASWGNPPPQESVFEPDQCWALRRGQTHLVSEIQSGPICPHVTSSPSAYICAPMMAHSEALGLLHLQSIVQAQTGNQWEESKRFMAQAVADSIALGLANLRLRETLRQQSIRDQLTGLFNRRYLEVTLERELIRAGRHQRPVGVIMLDLDHFKRFNDTFGHEAGDTLLRELGDFLVRHIRGSDIACRYGGEEFTLILPEASLAITRQRAERLCEDVRNLQVYNQSRALGPITMSLGVGMFPEHGSTVEALLRAADGALYRAKHEGRNRVVIAEP